MIATSAGGLGHSWKIKNSLEEGVEEKEENIKKITKFQKSSDLYLVV